MVSLGHVFQTFLIWVSNISKNGEITSLSGNLFQCMATFTGDFFFPRISNWSLCGCNLYPLLLFAQSWLNLGSTSSLQTSLATTGLCFPWDLCWWRHRLACFAFTLGSGVMFPYRAAYSPLILWDRHIEGSQILLLVLQEILIMCIFDSLSIWLTLITFPAYEKMTQNLLKSGWYEVRTHIT